VRGFQNQRLRAHLGEKTSGQVSRLLKRLRLHGMVKKVGHTYRYYLTTLGKQIIAAGLKLKNLVLIPPACAVLRALIIFCQMWSESILIGTKYSLSTTRD
jgi:hypothetical protein